MLTVSALSTSGGAAGGAVRSLRGVALGVGAGAFVAVLGGNGAGKSTLLRAIAGVERPVRGSIQFRGAELARLGPAQVLRRGVALVAGRPRPPADMRLAEALALGAQAGRGRVAAMGERVYALFPRLATLASTPCGALDRDALGLFAIARAVMTRPRLLLLDEPTAGLSAAAADTVLDALQSLHALGLSILLAEQNAAAALSLCEYGYVMQRGVVVAQGKPAELRDSRALLEAILG